MRQDGHVELQALRSWSVRRWRVASLGAVALVLLIGLPTDVISNPVFGRPVPVTWWSLPVLLVTAVLGGLLLATYVKDGSTGTDGAVGATDEMDRPAKAGGIGGALAFFAVGCPVCNKVVVLALGTTGALTWFEPLQPILAVGSLALMAFAVRARLRGEVACPLPIAR
jgi:hypothetical protein